MRRRVLLLTVVFAASTAWAASVKPVRGIDVIVEKRPGGKANRTVTSGDGTFGFTGLEPGSYVLRVNTCGTTEQHSGFTKSDPLVSFLVANPELTYIGFEIVGASCPISEEAAFRVRRVQDGSVVATTLMPIAAFAEGVSVEIDLESRAISGRIWGDPHEIAND